MSHWLQLWSHWCQCACWFLVRQLCSLEKRECHRSSSYLAQDVWWWSSSLISAKLFTCFLGCIGAMSIVLGIKSRLRESAQGDKWSFCLTAGKIWPANQERA